MTEKVKAALKASKKLDGTAKYDILLLLGQLEGELQAKDITIATLKNECLKHLLHNLKSDNKAILSDPVLALNRDLTKAKTKEGSDTSSASADATAQKLVALCNLVESQKCTLQRLNNCLREAENQRLALLNDLDAERRKHDELKAKSKRQSPELVAEVEAKDKADSDNEELQKLQAALSLEKKNTKDMVIVLMEDRRKMATLYVEEKKRSEELSRQLREEKSKVRALGMGLEEESKRSLAMEAELERYQLQINAQAEDLQTLRINGKELEDALRKARNDADHFKKQLSEAHRVAMSQATAAAAPLYAHTEALTSAAVAAASSSGSSISSSNSSLGLTASSLVTAAMNKQLIYDSYSSSSGSNLGSNKSRSSISSTATMVSRGSHRTVPNVTPPVPSDSMSATISRLTNSFQVNGGLAKKGPPPVPPNKPSVSLYKPLASKLDGIVGSTDAKSGAIDMAK